MAIDIEKIRRDLMDFDFVEFSGGVSEEEIKIAEETIGLQFDTEYKEFLHNFGAGGVSSEEFIGLGGPAHLDVVNMVEHLRTPSTHSPFQATLIPIRGDGYGNYDCLDSSQVHPEKGAKVVLWLHDGGEYQELKTLNSSYSEWLHATLIMIRELDAEK